MNFRSYTTINHEEKIKTSLSKYAASYFGIDSNKNLTDLTGKKLLLLIENSLLNNKKKILAFKLSKILAFISYPALIILSIYNYTTHANIFTVGVLLFIIIACFAITSYSVYFRMINIVPSPDEATKCASNDQESLSILSLYNFIELLSNNTNLILQRDDGIKGSFSKALSLGRFKNQFAIIEIIKDELNNRNLPNPNLFNRNTKYFLEGDPFPNKDVYKVIKEFLIDPKFMIYLNNEELNNLEKVLKKLSIWDSVCSDHFQVYREYIALKTRSGTPPRKNLVAMSIAEKTTISNAKALSSLSIGSNHPFYGRLETAAQKLIHQSSS